MIRRFLGMVLLTSAMAGCTTIQLEPLPEGMTNQPPAGWAERSNHLSGFDQWQLRGKLAVKQPSDSGTAIINAWRQQGESYDLSLSSSFLGMGTTRLKGTPGFIELTLANGETYQSSDPESLVAAATGWKLPIDKLVWWVRGLPAPDGDFRMLFDKEQQLATLTQNDWEIRYDRWQKFIENLPALPARITALNGDKRVRMVISEWQKED